MHTEFLCPETTARRMGEVAALHRAALPIAFITSLGTPFVRTMYRGIAAAPHSCGIVARAAEGQMAGFVSGTVSNRAMFAWILPRYGIRLLWHAAAQAWRPAVLRKTAETALYLLRRPAAAAPGAGGAGATVNAELLCIAVAPEFRKCGVGRALVGALEAFLVDYGCAEYRVVTHAEDQASNAFYGRAGFGMRRSFHHHGRPMNEYVKELGRG